MTPGGADRPNASDATAQGGRVGRERPTLEAVAAPPECPGRPCPASSTAPDGGAADPGRGTPGGRALGYVPNQAARSLVTQRTDSIALILPETANRVFSDDLFFPGIIRGVSRSWRRPTSSWC